MRCDPGTPGQHFSWGDRDKYLLTSVRERIDNSSKYRYCQRPAWWTTEFTEVTSRRRNDLDSCVAKASTDEDTWELEACSSLHSLQAAHQFGECFFQAAQLVWFFEPGDLFVRTLGEPSWGWRMWNLINSTLSKCHPYTDGIFWCNTCIKQERLLVCYSLDLMSLKTLVGGSETFKEVLGQKWCLWKDGGVQGLDFMFYFLA